MFLCYANEESDVVIGGSTKTAQHSIMNISRNIGAVFFNCTSQSKQNDTCRAIAMTTVMPLVLL